MTNPKQSQPGRSENVPFQKLVASTEQPAKALAPMIKCATRANCELASLAGRRAKAYLDLPGVFAQCRGPQDVFAAQASFWQAMVRDYAACSQRIVAALQDLDGEGTAEGGKSAGRERDLLTFPNVFGFPAWPLPESGEPRRGEEDRAA